MQLRNHNVTKGQIISKWFFGVLDFGVQKNEQKQVDLRYHSSKVEFLCSFIGGKSKTSKTLYLTSMDNDDYGVNF